ncbi:unnamed protein product [Dracunculus medinensis]|uniref:Coat protein n=1 Tax=Dracunculus medinensis TaxID=318479 RepID=A0A0N4UCX6_DRAME|nr:unnamed protein product [Dracunculus medinensis]
MITGGSSGGRTRPPPFGGRSPQSSFDSNGDVGQISVNLMLVNGGITPFKSLLTSYNSPAAGLKSSSSTHLCRVASLKKQSNTLHHTYDINRWKGSGTKLASEAPALAIEVDAPRAPDLNQTINYFVA